MNVSIRFVSSDAMTNHKLVVYLTENGLIADQANYLNYDDTSYFYEMGNNIQPLSAVLCIQRDASEYPANSVAGLLWSFCL